MPFQGVTKWPRKAAPSNLPRVFPLKPTHIEVYVFRRRPRIELLLLRRAAHDSLPGAWQPVTGSIRRGESAVVAARREVREETGLKPRAWWRLESVVQYLDVAGDQVRVLALFAAEMDADAKPRLSREHDAVRHASLAKAATLVLWDTQRATLRALRSQIFGSARLAAALEIVRVARDSRAKPPRQVRAITPRQARAITPRRRGLAPRRRRY